MYLHFNKFILRTPKFPISFSFNKFDEILSQSDFIKNDDILYLASPAFHEEYTKQETQNKKDKQQSLYSLVRYLNRMSTRCTPFGLFAGCSIGEIGVTTNIFIDKKTYRTTRLDMYFLCALSQALTQIPEIKNQLKYFPNTSLYNIGKKYRYVECYFSNAKKIHKISSVDQSVYLNSVLKEVESGTFINQLIACLVSDEISFEDASFFIDEMINEQLLISELDPIVTGGDYFEFILNILNRINCPDYVFLKLKKIRDLLNCLDNETDHPLDIYPQIIQLIDDIQIPYEEKMLFQVDMIRHLPNASLGKEIIEEIQSTLNFVNKITPYIKKESLETFKQTFFNRYEYAEVPLMEALDPESGIGYPVQSGQNDISPLIDNFILPEEQTGNTKLYNPLEIILLNKAIEIINLKQSEIILSDNDLDDLNNKSEWRDLPPTISVLFSVFEDEKNNNLVKLLSARGASGANLISRFSHTSPSIHSFVQEIIDKEQEITPDAILAEIVHLPESRVGNILSRPHLREYELVYLAHSDLPLEKQLKMDDLFLSIRRGKLSIHSKKLGKEIIPRLTTAHNYHNNSIPVYQFLCDMQHPNGRNELYLSWGTLLNDLEYLPRVRYKNTILWAATWNVKNEEIKPFISIENEEILIGKITEWRQKRFIPQYVSLIEADRELFVDWENNLSIQALFSIIKNHPVVRFEEFLFHPEKGIVKGEDGIYANEFIVTFYKEQEKR